MKYLLALLLLSSGCATKPKQYARGALINLILRPRPGYKGLTNQTCREWADGHCIKRDVAEWDLAVDKERLQLHSLRFVCDVGGRRYRICRQLPGLCRQTYVKSGFLGLDRELKLISYLNAREEYQFLIDSDTVCMSMDSELSRDTD